MSTDRRMTPRIRTLLEDELRLAPDSYAEELGRELELLRQTNPHGWGLAEPRRARHPLTEAEAAAGVLRRLGYPL